ncbi:MAG: peptidylprolyl isomerase [Thermoguttaceae bacterium]
MSIFFLFLAFFSGGLSAQNGKPVESAVSRVANSNPIHQEKKTLLPEVVAEVNGQKITADELKAETLRVHGPEVLERIENRVLVLAECKRRQVTITRDEVNKEIERLAKANRLSAEQFTDLIKDQNGMTAKQYADEVIWPRLALQALVAPEIAVSDEELEKEYLKNYGPSVVMQQIMTKTKEEADDVHARVTADPDSFGDVAKNESTDMITASNKGRMQPVRRYAFSDPQLEDLFFSMNPGDISDVVGPYGPENEYIIFKCENRYDSVVPQEKIDEIKGLLRSRAADEKLKTAANALFERLGKEADVVNVLGDPELMQKYPNTAALVGGHPILLESIIDKSLELYARQDLEGLILFTLLRQELKKVGATITDQDIDTEIWIKAAETTYPLPDGKPNIEAYMKRELEATHFSEKVYRTNIVWPELVIRKLSEPLVQVTDEDLQKGYEANFGPKVQCLGIFVQDQRLAQEAWQKARTIPARENRPLEEVFGDLAAKYSAEPGSRQMRGRIAPIIKNGGMPTLEEEAFALSPGELSGVIQVDRNSFVILYCQEIIPAQAVSFEDAKETLTTSVHRKKAFLAARQYLVDLYKRSTINNFLTGQKTTPKVAGGADNYSRQEGLVVGPDSER